MRGIALYLYYIIVITFIIGDIIIMTFKSLGQANILADCM